MGKSRKLLGRPRASLIVGLLLSLGGTMVGAGACTKSKDTEDTIPSTRGVTQPKGGGDAISETDACEQLLAAEDDARDRLGCDTPKGRPECPAYVRPAGSEPCLQFDAKSVDACKGALDDYVACSDFEQHPCVLTIIPFDPEKPDPRTPDSCPDLFGGSGGSDGSGGAGGSDGGAGSPSTGGTPSVGGSGSGAPGVGGAGGNDSAGGSGGAGGGAN